MVDLVDWFKQYGEEVTREGENAHKYYNILSEEAKKNFWKIIVIAHGKEKLMQLLKSFLDDENITNNE